MGLKLNRSSVIHIMAGLLWLGMVAIVPLGIFPASSLAATRPLAVPPTAAVSQLTVGSKVFNANCSACHMGGNNVIIAAKTLKKEALEKFEMDSLEKIQAQVTFGKNAMPAFRGRLTQAQIDAVAAYVLTQAQKGWVN